MAEIESNWKFAEDLIVETDPIRAAREEALELGLRPLSPAAGAQLAVLAAATAAASMIEIGTGTGVSGLWLMEGAPSDAQLTSIDLEPEHHRIAKAAFAAAEISPGRLRLIGGRPLDVLPRMNEAAYDLVVVAAEAGPLADYLEHGLRLVRPGGVVVMHGALRGGRLADPAQRDPLTRQWRELVARAIGDEALIVSLVTAGEGLLQVTRRL